MSLVLPAERADGTRCVLKINFPAPESEHEAQALAFWEGRGAVRLLEHDPGRRALLVERCEPGTKLWEVVDDDEATGIAAGVMARLWRPPPPGHSLRALAAEALRWREEIPERWEGLGRPFEARLVEELVAAVSDLVPTQGELVVCHQDLHGGNVLRAAREPWLAIDPKPLVGEREFDAASLLRDRRWDIRSSVIRRRLDLLVAALALDRERTRGWAIVHALAWGVSGATLEADMVECARILSRL